MCAGRSRVAAGALMLALLVSGISFAAGPAQPPATVTEVPQAVRDALKLDHWSKKYTSAGGLPVLSSEKVSDAGLLEAAYLINQMLADRGDIRKAMIKSKCRFV